MVSAAAHGMPIPALITQLLEANGLMVVLFLLAPLVTPIPMLTVDMTSVSRPIVDLPSPLLVPMPRWPRLAVTLFLHMLPTFLAQLVP